MFWKEEQLSCTSFWCAVFKTNETVFSTYFSNKGICNIIVNICTGVLKFYKGAFPSHSYIQSACDSFACKSFVSLASDFAFQAVKKEFPDVLDFLM